MTREGAARPWGRACNVNLAFAEHAEEVAALDVDGVGLLRAEFMTDALAASIPACCSTVATRNFVDAMASSLLRITGLSRPAGGLPEHRLSHPNEFSNLEGGERYEPTRTTQ